MKTDQNLLMIYIWLILLIGCGNSGQIKNEGKKTLQNSENKVADDSDSANTRESKTKLQQSREEALNNADKEASKTHTSLKSFNRVICDVERVWVVIYDGGGPDVYVSKTSRDVLAVRNVPQKATDEERKIQTGKPVLVDKEKAVSIAKDEFKKMSIYYGANEEEAQRSVKDYDAHICELKAVWRVFFSYRIKPEQDIKTLPNTNPPNYVIDKETGRVIYTTHPLKNN
jgi:hypothetical protein